MKASTNTILVDNYYGLLSRLSREAKMKLIEKLSNSIVVKTVDNNDAIDRFFGAFNSDKNAEEIIQEITESRRFNRKIEPF